MFSRSFVRYLHCMTAMSSKHRGEYAKTAGRRQEIVNAAIEVFSGSGFHKGSLRDVAEKVGLSQAGVLHHFPSKSHLVEAVLAWRDEDSQQRMGNQDHSLEGVGLLRALIALTEHNEQTPELVELHVVLSAEATSPEHPVHQYFVDRYAAVFDAIRQAFVQADGLGQLNPGVDPASAARTLIALMDGLQVQWLLDRASVHMADDVRRYVQSLLTVEL